MMYEVRISRQESDGHLRYLKTIIFDTFIQALNLVERYRQEWGTFYSCEIIGEDD